MIGNPPAPFAGRDAGQWMKLGSMPCEGYAEAWQSYIHRPNWNGLFMGGNRAWAAWKDTHTVTGYTREVSSGYIEASLA